MNKDTVSGSKPVRKNTNDRITLESLKYYIPLFHIGDKASERLIEEENLKKGEKNALESQALLKQMSVDKIASLSGPLITKEINKLIKNSHLNGRDDLFDILYYAGINGMIKGLRHFDVDKMNKSSTNYLFQWIVTYAKKELAVIEAPFGVAPSRFQRYKKISAVRKKLSEQLERYATNEEVLEFFITGKADIKTMSGRLDKSNEPYAVNKNMSIDIIEEQENFEQNLNYVNLLDPLEDYNAEITLSHNDIQPFSQTLFGVFLESYNFTEEAVAVFVSDLKYPDVKSDYADKAEMLSQSEYKNISVRWKDLMRDINGPFYSFLVEVENHNFEFNILETKNAIEQYSKKIKPERYLPLFKDNRIVRL